MNETAFRAFPAAGIVALFDEAGGGGDILDIDAPRNRPAKYPDQWLPKVYFHSELDYMDVALQVSTTISPTQIDAISSSASSDSPASVVYGDDGAAVEWTLATHDLGYEPLCLVAIGSNLLTPGYPVQVPGSTNGSARFATPFVTTTQVKLRETRIAGAAALAATSFTFSVLVFRQMPAASGDKLIDFDKDTGALTLGRSRFDSASRYLQVVPGGSPFGLSVGRTIDLKNGAYRIIRPDGAYVDPVPSTTRTGIWFGGGQFATDTLVYGEAMNYTGTFTGSGSVQVQAP